MATPGAGSAPQAGVSRTRMPARIKLDAAILKKVIEADSYLDKPTEESAQRLYEYNCNLRELETYNLFKKMVQNMNEQLKTRQERMRLIEEGDGLYIELE